MGILAKDGIVMASERRITSGLLAPAKVSETLKVDIDAAQILQICSFVFLSNNCCRLNPSQTSEKTYQLCSHVSCNVAGLTADANILIDQARLRAGRYAYQYQEPIPVEQLVEYVCNYKQFYTQRGGLRPFGVAFLFAGYDEHYGFQLYQSDPSGNYSGWKATVIGSNNQAGKSLLKAEYKTDESKMQEGTEDGIPNVEEALKLAVKVLNKTMDGTTAAAAAEKMELYTMTIDGGVCVHHILNKTESQAVIDAVEAESASAGDS